MSVSLEWLGVSTYRLVVDDLVIFLDAPTSTGIRWRRPLVFK